MAKTIKQYKKEVEFLEEKVERLTEEKEALKDQLKMNMSLIQMRQRMENAEQLLVEHKDQLTAMTERCQSLGTENIKLRRDYASARATVKELAGLI